MPSRFTRTRAFKVAFILDIQTIRRIVHLLSEYSNLIGFTVGFGGGAALECDNIDDVLTVDNTKVRPVLSLVIRTRNFDGLTAVVRFRAQDSSWPPPIEYDASGNEKDVDYIADRLDEYLSNISQWYAIFAFLNYFYIYFAIFGTFSLVTWLYTYTVAAMANHIPSADWNALFSPAGLKIAVTEFLVVIGLLILSFLLNEHKYRIFPVGEFLIGDGVTRHSETTEIRRAVLVGIGIAFAVGVASTLFASAVFGK